MTFARILLAGALLIFFSASALAGDCREPKTGTRDVPVLSPPLANVVIGRERLQFYSAPDLRCEMKGVFVIPKDELITYAESDDGWSSVMYINPKTGNAVTGWVRSARLKQTGTVGPKR